MPQLLQPLPMPDLDLRARALRALSRREHSRVQLRAKLAPAAESAEQLEQLLDTLENQQLLSDPRYAAARVRCRAGSYGNARLRLELRAQGITGEAASTALAESGDELLRCQNVWQKKYDKIAIDAAERAKQMRFLQTRGFAAEIIRQVISGIES